MFDDCRVRDCLFMLIAVCCKSELLQGVCLSGKVSNVLVVSCLKTFECG